MNEMKLEKSKKTNGRRNGSYVGIIKCSYIYILYKFHKTGKYHICPLNSMLCMQYFCAVYSFESTFHSRFCNKDKENLLL